MKKYLKPAAACIIAAALIVSAFLGISRLPDTVYISPGDEFNYRRGLLKASPAAKDVAALSSQVGESYPATLSLFGSIPLKKVKVMVTSRAQLTVLGTPFGVKMFTNGVIVVGFGTVPTALGDCCPAKESGLQLGDNIISVKGVGVTGNNELAALVSANGSRPMEVVFERAGEQKRVNILPVSARDGTGYKIGMWVRDSTAGIGTATYFDQSTGIMAGLGHAIADTDTGVVMPVATGELVTVSVVGTVKGISGAPGELTGILSHTEIARLIYNCENGIFAIKKDNVSLKGAELPIAFKHEISEGEAEILTTVNGSEPDFYSCRIKRVYLNSSKTTKNMVIEITDRRLIELTGGIVQGMSGSPIVQNGRLVGAVTHVFVNDPTLGYGIFIENMLSQQKIALQGSTARQAA